MVTLNDFSIYLRTYLYISICQKTKTQKIVKQNIDIIIYIIVFRSFNLSKWMGRSSQI